MSSAAAVEFFRHDADLAPVAVEPVGGVLWLRERRFGGLAVDPVDGSVLWRVSPGPQLVGGSVATGAGYLVAAESGQLLRLDATGGVVGRTTVARRITALRQTGAGELIVVTKGTLMGVAATGDSSTWVDISSLST